MTQFSFERALRFGDCDPSGIAYFPSYLNILNGVVEEFWATIGFPWPALITARKIGTPTVHLSCDFSRPSLFGDLLTFKLRIIKVGRASLHLAHAVSGTDSMRWQARQVVAATSLVNHQAIPWPATFARRYLHICKPTSEPSWKQSLPLCRSRSS